MAKIEIVRTVRFEGLLGGTNASAVGFTERRALVVADEVTAAGENVVQAFERKGDVYKARPAENVVLDPPGPRDEMDLEGLAVADDGFVYVLGSHAARRWRVEATNKVEKNRAILLSPPEPQPARDVLLRYPVDAEGRAGGVERATLRPYLDAHEPFRSFRDIPSKENGVDAEGLAVRDGWVWVGFRGPVLRGNFTPVLRLRFGPPIADVETRFLALGGLGVRDLAAVSDGLLVLAGPVGDGPGPYRLYHWDGEDTVGGKDLTRAPGLRLLGDLPLPSSRDAEMPPKAEGLAVVEETATAWKIFVVFDGAEDGHAIHCRADR